MDASIAGRERGSEYKNATVSPKGYRGELTLVWAESSPTSGGATITTYLTKSDP